MDGQPTMAQRLAQQQVAAQQAQQQAAIRKQQQELAAQQAALAQQQAALMAAQQQMAAAAGGAGAQCAACMSAQAAHAPGNGAPRGLRREAAASWAAIDATRRWRAALYPQQLRRVRQQSNAATQSPWLCYSSNAALIAAFSQQLRDICARTTRCAGLIDASPMGSTAFGLDGFMAFCRHAARVAFG